MNYSHPYHKNYNNICIKLYNQMINKFDLIVIGSGSGLDVANGLAERGFNVAIIEKNKLGGTCLNVGCIPSKLLIHSADIIQLIKKADVFGVNVKNYSINYQKIVNRVNNIVDNDSEKIKKGLQQVENPKLFLGECKFIGEKKIIVGKNITLTANKILIAAGARPTIPKIKGLEKVNFITSNEALRLKKLPKILTIIGGGYIACELAHFFGSLGTKINMIQRSDKLIPREDIDIARKFTRIFSKKYNIYLGYNAEYVSKITEKGKKSFYVLAYNKHGKKLELSSDQLLVATGRIPNSDLLNIEKTNVKVDKKGFIKVNKYLETNVKGIFALGDIVGRYQFKHNSNNEAYYAFNNILYPEKQKVVNYTAMPHAIFSSPQIAGVGFTEQDLKEMDIQYIKSSYPFLQTGMGKAIEDRDGFVKFLIGKSSRKILGCHIIGTEASILIHEVLVAMKSAGKIDNINNTIHIHPSLSEVVQRAASITT